jgi:hypothetical protein
LTTPATVESYATWYINTRKASFYKKCSFRKLPRTVTIEELADERLVTSCELSWSYVIL